MDVGEKERSGKEIASFQRSRVMTNARTSWFVANDSAGVAAESAEESQRKIILYADNDDLRNRRRQPAARRIRARRLAKQQARRLAKQQARHLAKQQARRLAKPQTRLWMRRISAVHHTKPYRALLIYLPFCLMVFLLQPDLVFSKGGGGVTSSTSGGGYYGGGGGASSSSSTRWVFWYTGNGSRTCGNYCIITFSVIGAVILAIILCGVYRCVRICRDSKNRDLESNFNFEKRQPYIYSAPPNDLYAPLPSTSPTVQNTSLPPDYETTPPAPEAIHLSGKYRDAPTFEADAAEEYTRSYPPKNDLPPAEHREYIRNQGGVRAWQMTANPNRGVQVTDHGRTVCFSAKNDAMVQANYPMFTPEDKPKIDTTAHFKRDHDQPNSPAIVESAAPPYSFNNGPFAAGGSLANDELDSFKRRSRSVDDDSDVGLEAVGLYYYFEITVKEKPNRRNTAIAIGLSTKPYPEFRLPGWNKHSVAYHSDDGRKFCDDSKGGRNYSEEWRRVGDTVGCGYNPNTGYVFFTKNGKFMGIAFTGQCHVFFPTVGADGPCTVEVNFGDREFTFEKARGHSVAVAR